MAERVTRSSRRARNPVNYNARGPRIMPYGNSRRTQQVRQRARQQEQDQLAVALADGRIEIDENAPLSLVCIVNFSQNCLHVQAQPSNRTWRLPSSA